jgi:hypothetical protein
MRGGPFCIRRPGESRDPVPPEFGILWNDGNTKSEIVCETCHKEFLPFN